MKPGDSAKKHLLEIAELNIVEMIVVGYHGRKGPKKDPTVMGTAVQYMGINSVIPTMIIKDPSKRVTKPNGFKFVACVDGSHKKLELLDLLCNLQSGKDRIQVLIYDHESLDALKIK